MSLRAKLIGLFFLLAVVPLVAIGLIGYAQSMRALRALIAAQTGTIAERASTELRERYAQRESDLLLLAENAETQRMYRARASGDATQWAAAFSVADAYLRSAWEQFARSYEWIEFRDRRGVVVYRLGEAVSGAAGAGARGALTVTKPIVDPRGEAPFGTLAAVVRLDALLPSAVLENRFGRAGYTMVLDRVAGVVVYHPSHALVRQPVAALLGPGGWGVDTALLRRERGSFGYRERDTARVAAFVSLATPPWTVLSSGAVDEFAGPFVRTRLVNLALVLLVTATTAVAFVLLTRRATRSLEALTIAADEVGGGNLAPDLPRAGGDEVGRLSAAFGMMVGRVRGMLREVETSRNMAAVGEFAARLSHEIRNPLTSIKLNLQRLERDASAGGLPPDSVVPVRISLREIERLDRVVRGVLALGGDRPGRRETCGLHGILAEALEVVRPQLEQQGVVIETGFDAPCDRVAGELEHLKAVFLNLFLNAAEAMPDGGRLRVTSEGDTFDHHLGRSGFEVRTAASGAEALGLVGAYDPALVISDLRMPGMDGLELLRRVRSGPDDPDVVVITAHDDMASAIEAMKAGAYDYLVKPLDLDQIDLVIQRCLRERALRRRVQQLTTAAAASHGLESLVGREPPMVEIYKLIGMLAGNRATVLVRGETGTGKERIARAIHFNSPQAAEPFIAVNCTALTETLLASELFGHVRGAFTGAVANRRGCFELAGSGTIFLDEIGDTTPEFQARLLRVLEEREFFPVGAERPRRTEARVIAATHRPIEELVRVGSFREDLYFRLKVVEIVVPPLRDRRGDIPLLAVHLLARIAGELHKDVRVIADEAMRLLTAYDWPGNVRELENALTRAAVLARGPALTPEHLSLVASSLAAAGGDAPSPADQTLEAATRAHVERVLARTGGNKRQAARVLGISRPRLDRILAGDRRAATDRD